MATTEATEKSAPGSASMAREIGLIGMLWASVGSIIGSGWLFGAQKGLIAAGPAAILSWIIGGACILVLALVHAELGGMFPMSGGSARFPHYAFGGIAGAGFGWFSWLQAVAVAPIEVSAMIGYLTNYHWAQSWVKPNGNLSHTGIWIAVVIMALVTIVNYLGVKVLAATNNVLTWWKAIVPFAALLIVLTFSSKGPHGSNFHTAGGFAPSWQSLVGLITSASVLMYAGAPLALGAFRKRLPDYSRPYVMPLGSILSPLAFVISTWIIVWTGWVTDYKLGVLIILGSLFIFNREMKPEHFNWRAAAWLPVYLVGTGLITYFSTFGGEHAFKHPMNLAFSLIVPAVFSIAIYFWAINVSLSGETIQRMIDEVVVPEEDELGVPAGH